MNNWDIITEGANMETKPYKLNVTTNQCALNYTGSSFAGGKSPTKVNVKKETVKKETVKKKTVNKVTAKKTKVLKNNK